MDPFQRNLRSELNAMSSRSWRRSLLPPSRSLCTRPSARETRCRANRRSLRASRTVPNSLHVCAEHLGDSVPADMRVTHFLFHDAGSHLWQELATDRLTRARASALAMHRPLININANLELFFRPLKLGYQQTHTLRSAAIAFSLSGRAKTYLYASSYSYSAIAVRETLDTATIDPILLPLLKSETTECFSVGASTSRVEKLAMVCETEVARRFFDVCVYRWPNCSCCWKCART